MVFEAIGFMGQKLKKKLYDEGTPGICTAVVLTV